MEIKNGAPEVKAPVLTSVFEAEPGRVYRHKDHVYDGAPNLCLRTKGGSMMLLATGEFHRMTDVYSRDWIEVGAYVTYTGDKK